MKLPEIQTPDSENWLPRAGIPLEEACAAQAASREEYEQRFRDSWNKVSRQRLLEGKDAIFRGLDDTDLKVLAIPQSPMELPREASIEILHAAQDTGSVAVHAMVA